MPPRIKVCCISSREEASTAISFGASAIGLVGRMPSGPGIISNELIRDIALFTPPGISSFLLTCETEPDGIISHHAFACTTVLQLVDHVKPAAYATIRSALPSVKIVQVIHVRDRSSVDEALLAAAHVDALLLDSGNPNLAVKELGGTGRVHDWSLSADIVRQTDTPVFLAGGLHAGNVKEALDRVQPFGLDICSGVRTNNALDPARLEAFFRAALS